jgi:hypothetical protein
VYDNLTFESLQGKCLTSDIMPSKKTPNLFGKLGCRRSHPDLKKTSQPIALNGKNYLQHLEDVMENIGKNTAIIMNKVLETTHLDF